MTNTDSNNTAIILDSAESTVLPMVEIQDRGEYVMMTLENLKSSEAYSGLDEEEFERCMDCATRLTQKIVNHYTRCIAEGEVGVEGVGRAISEEIASEQFPNILLYGNVQAGKTLVMQLSAAMCLDNGFRCVIVLTPDFTSLLDQTALRFDDIDDPLSVVVRCREPWSADAELIRRELPHQGLVIVASKNSHNQKRLLEFLDEIEASGCPVLVIDDEADQATPDTNTRRRALGTNGTMVRGSTINRRIISNDDPEELGQSLMQKLTHSVLMTVTATPQALLLQDPGTALRPDDVFVLEPGKGYIGGDYFFNDAALQGDGPLVMVDQAEARQLMNTGIRRAPEGLAASVTTFVFSAALLEVKEGYRPRKGHVYLCHNSALRGHHDIVTRLVKDHLDRLQLFLAGGSHDADIALSVTTALNQLESKHGHDRELVDRCVEWLLRQIPRRNVLKVNSNGDRLNYRRGLNLLVGGNILSRGLTIENLLTTYYLRSPQVSQEDTMLQHARMFGYRDEVRDYLKVFLTRRLANRFAEIVKADRLLRAHLAEDGTGDRVPLRFVRGLRPTRIGVLDPRIMTTYEGGRSISPMDPVHDAPGIASSMRILPRLLESSECFDADIDSVLEDGGECEVPMDLMIDLISEIPENPQEPSSWDPDAVIATLRMISSEYGNRAFIKVRPASNSRDPVLAGSGWLDGRERVRSVNSGVPVLHLHLVKGSRDRGWRGHPFWVPVVVFPPDMGNMMIAGE